MTVPKAFLKSPSYSVSTNPGPACSIGSNIMLLTQKYKTLEEISETIYLKGVKWFTEDCHRGGPVIMIRLLILSTSYVSNTVLHGLPILSPQNLNHNFTKFAHEETKAQHCQLIGHESHSPSVGRSDYESCGSASRTCISKHLLHPERTALMLRMVVCSPTFTQDSKDHRVGNNALGKVRALKSDLCLKPASYMPDCSAIILNLSEHSSSE